MHDLRQEILDDLTVETASAVRSTKSWTVYTPAGSSGHTSVSISASYETVDGLWTVSEVDTFTRTDKTDDEMDGAGARPMKGGSFEHMRDSELASVGNEVESAIISEKKWTNYLSHGTQEYRSTRIVCHYENDTENIVEVDVFTFKRKR